MRVRAARPSDAPRIVEFQVAMAAETESIVLKREVVRRGVRRLFREPERGRYWIAESAHPSLPNREVLGVMLTIPEWSEWRNGIVLWLHSVYVVPTARRRGVFSKLYAHVKKLVERSPKYCGLRLYVDQRNRAAQRVYRALGMNGDHYQMFEWMK
ncbi:MAG: GNAT family N-acetyltransferase [Pirellulales bacterium]